MTETLSSFDVELGPTRCFRLFKPLGGVYDAEATVTWPADSRGTELLRIGGELAGACLTHHPVGNLTDEEKQMILDIIYARWGS